MQVWNISFSGELYQQAKNYFLALGRSDFLSKSPLSLCGRYGISKKMKEFGFLNFIPEDGIYTCGEYTYAISHSHDQLFFAVDTENVTVDVEKIVARDETLLGGEFQRMYAKNFRKCMQRISEKYEKKIPLDPPLGKGAIRECFYFQWCAKECLIKFLNLSSVEMEKMSVIEFGELNEKSAASRIHYGDFGFAWYLVLEYEKNLYTIRLLKKGEYMYALLK